jgi:hypothetical protein
MIGDASHRFKMPHRVRDTRPAYSALHALSQRDKSPVQIASNRLPAASGDPGGLLSCAAIKNKNRGNRPPKAVTPGPALQEETL